MRWREYSDSENEFESEYYCNDYYCDFKSLNTDNFPQVKPVK